METLHMPENHQKRYIAPNHIDDVKTPTVILCMTTILITTSSARLMTSCLLFQL
jgi:hypothetical protein